MKIIIFAGGVGTRLWPLSRKSTPKQFEKIIGERSTLQETVDRLRPQFRYEDIFVATGIRYKNNVKEQLPQIPSENFIFEPEMRDVGPAIGLVTVILQKRFPNEPIAILWSDHLVKNVDVFKNCLQLAESYIKSSKADFVFVAQKPRFANQNMGWIEVGDELSTKDGIKVYKFKRLRYRPSLDEALLFFKNKSFVWNLGYFVTTPSFLSSLFKINAAKLYDQLSALSTNFGTSEFDVKLNKIYPNLEKISFDDAVLVNMKPDNVLVLSSDLGWSDIGAWESLKEALSETESENVTKGKVMLQDSIDSLVFNYTDQLSVGIDLEGLLVVNTNDVLLVCPKKSVPKIKKLVESLSGTEHETLT